VDAGSRLTREQLAALAPGDPVTIETGADLGRSRHTTGTVVRTGPSHVVVSVAGAWGGTFIERYSVRDGLRGSGGRAELSSPIPTTPRPGICSGAARSASTPRTASGAAAAPTCKRYANCRTPSATTWQRR
jgi:hypothetical protein